MFKRNGIYYVIYSDPNCGYCSGTGASYKMAKSPLGPWSESKKISDNSCGGQPSFVSTIKLNSNQIFLFGSDLWNDGAKNEALANYYWSPLTFNSDGTIKPLDCGQNFKVTGKQLFKMTPGDTLTGSFKGSSEIAAGVKLIQTFTSSKTGTLNKIYLPLYKKGVPDKGLKVELYTTDGKDKPNGEALFSQIILPQNLGWAIKRQILSPKIHVTKGAVYCLMISSETSDGSYGYTYNRQDELSNDASISKIQKDSIITETGKKINFSINIRSSK